MPTTSAPLQPAVPQTPSPEGSAQLTIRLCQTGRDRCESCRPERLSEVIKDEGTLVWVDIRNPGSAELDLLRQEFGFHHLALEDAAKQQQRPKVDAYPSYEALKYYFVVIYAPLPVKPGETIRLTEIDLFVGRNYLVSLHQGDVPAINEAGERWERTDPDLRHEVGFLVHTVVDSLIDAYFPVVDTIEDQLDTLELRLFRPRHDGRGPEQMLGVKRSLLTLRRAVYPMREVFNAFLRHDHSLFSADTYPFFQDVYDHVLRLLDIVDIQRDMATGVLDAHLAVISNRLNETMKTLTLLAICVAIMGAVFGAWGMNFDWIPLQHLRHGFAFVCGGAGALIALAMLWAKRRGLW